MSKIPSIIANFLKILPSPLFLCSNRIVQWLNQLMMYQLIHASRSHVANIQSVQSLIIARRALVCLATKESHHIAVLNVNQTLIARIIWLVQMKNVQIPVLMPVAKMPNVRFHFM